ncbi:hypothetical protein QLH51_17505 [Sphingomonas sp. 2R-10]|uniref:hypothetical protein n=1 Tax=Sphingomonas sp. 2R-10 TaxID=3045148 RepID=UPI0013DDE5EF|nr:hypothetical protein [Sphingomonas sp. 2R-10]MDJ0278591.1 hypothetical protein [Sphingomonas sp. 2R-10]
MVSPVGVMLVFGLRPGAGVESASAVLETLWLMPAMRTIVASGLFVSLPPDG